MSSRRHLSIHRRSLRCTLGSAKDPLARSGRFSSSGPSKPSARIAASPRDGESRSSGRLRAPSSLPDQARSSVGSPVRPALAIERLTVRTGRLVCHVALAPDAPRLTSPALAARVCAAFPNLPHHACVNNVGDTFAAVMDCTPLPHLLEHLVVDLQAQAASPSSDDVFVGVTEWTDEEAGRARVEVSFTDDLIALRAFRDAVDFLNAVVVL